MFPTVSSINNALTLHDTSLPRSNPGHAPVVDRSQRPAVSPTDAQAPASAVVCLSNFKEKEGTYKASRQLLPETSSSADQTMTINNAILLVIAAGICGVSLGASVSASVSAKAIKANVEVACKTAKVRIGNDIVIAQQTAGPQADPHGIMRTTAVDVAEAGVTYVANQVTEGLAALAIELAGCTILIVVVVGLAFMYSIYET